MSERPAPLHPFEVRINIGANDREYIVDTLRELAADFEAGRDGSVVSGGWSGSHGVTVAKRDITPEVYRAELEEWSSLVIQKGETLEANHRKNRDLQPSGQFGR